MKHAQKSRLPLGLAECSRGVDRHICIQSLAHGSDGRKSRADFKRDPGKDELLATSGLDGASNAFVVEGIDRRTVDDRDARQCFDELGERGTPHAVACRGGNDDRQLQRFRRSRQGHHVVFQLTGRIITDAGHEADLMINENERRIFGGEGLGADLISHYIFLLS